MSTNLNVALNAVVNYKVDYVLLEAEILIVTLGSGLEVSLCFWMPKNPSYLYTLKQRMLTKLGHFL